MLDCVVAGINNDTKTLSATTGIKFPKHLSDEVCEYIVVGDGYFDFKGRDGLIKTLRRFVPDAHFSVAAVKDARYKSSIEKLSPLRNFAAHSSTQAKVRALNAVNQKKIGSAGAWLKVQGRFDKILADLRALASDLRKNAPF
jgi:hypothetical protein